MKTRHLFIPFALSLGLILVLLWAFGGQSTPVVAAPKASMTEDHIEAPSVPAAELHVCPAGPPTCDYASVQAAVDAANDGDVIKVATGDYTDMHIRPRNDVTTTGVVTQVVYISKTVTMQGGYTITNWTTPYPITQPTTLDALGQGRVLYITGDISPTVEGLHITGGDATGLGGFHLPSYDRDAGGGVYIISATAILKDNQIFSNAADYGSGLYLVGSNALLSGNVVQNNTANLLGGGLGLYYSDATLINNIMSSNTSNDHGGGLHLSHSNATLSGNAILSNVATFGGGLALYESGATLIGNSVLSNTADNSGGLYLLQSDAALLKNNFVSGNIADHYGGGFYLANSDAILSGNVVLGNTADERGGGLHLYRSNATLTNNVIADNHVGDAGRGSGMHIGISSPRLLHTTIARNSGGGSGIYITGYEWWPYHSTVALTNTILVSHTVGISVTGGNTVTVNGILWDNSTPITISHSVTASVTMHNQYTGDPAFAADGYHLTTSSAAIDKGVDAGVITDIDDEPRPTGLGYDLGADEWNPPVPVGGTTFVRPFDPFWPYGVYLRLVLRSD